MQLLCVRLHCTLYTVQLHCTLHNFFIVFYDLPFRVIGWYIMLANHNWEVTLVQPLPWKTGECAMCSCDHPIISYQGPSASSLIQTRWNICCRQLITKKKQTNKQTNKQTKNKQTSENVFCECFTTLDPLVVSRL